jgi:Ca-activated chloride channel family protein
MDDFHFLRPLWLLALPLGPLLAWSLWQRLHAGVQWRDVCDPHLLPHLLVAPTGTRRKLPYWVLAVATALALLALAGPAWERLEQPVYRTLNARVVVLDLSRSMDATDFQPSRLIRARYKVVDILRRSRDRPVGLAVFAADGFIVTPLTQDANTLISLLPAVDTDIMPAQGSRADLGLKAAVRMLERGGARRGEVILITDGVKGKRAEMRAAELRDAGFRVSVLAAGTPEGAPIPIEGGGFFKELKGGIVVAMTDYEALRAIARAGGGRFASLSNGDGDIDYLLSGEIPRPWDVDMQAMERTSEVWRDRGPWLLLALLPLAALAFRRGWLLLIPLTVVVMPVPARAVTWDDLWARPDQQAARALEDGDPARAAGVTRDPLWKGAALYRDRQYEEAVDALAESDETMAHYNRGNALARAGRLRAALNAYDAVLQMDPQHRDALHNRTLVARLMEQIRQRSRQHKDSTSGGQGREGGNDRQQGSANDDRRDAMDQSEDASGGRDDSGTRDRDAQATSEVPAAIEQPPLTAEEQQAMAQWLRRIPDDPGGLLRRKFQLEYSKRRPERPQGTDAW